MKTLHEGPNLHLKQDSEGLTLDVKWGGRITRDQIKLIESKGMVEGENDTWYGGNESRAEVEQIVKAIDEPWIMREQSRQRTQEIMGGR